MAAKRKNNDSHGVAAKKKKPAKDLEAPAVAVSGATRSKSKSKDLAEPASSHTPAPMTKIGEPKQQKTIKPWSPEEKAYLEIMYQKLHNAAASKSHSSLPHARKVFSSLNSFFNEDREWGSFTSHVGRPTNKAINGLRKDIMKKMNDNSDNAWIPDITEEEIEAHLKHGPVTAKSGPTKAVKQIAKDTPAPIKQVGKPDPKAKPGHTKQKMMEPSTGTMDAVTSKPTDVLEPPNEQQHTKHQLPSKSTKGESFEKNVLIEAVSRSPTNVFNGEVPVKVTPVEEANRLVAAGYKFTEIPEDDEEAIERYLKEGDVQQPDGSWIKTAEDDLDGRIQRLGKPDKFRKLWRPDRGPGKFDAQEDWHKVSVRRDGAAAVNGLLCTAVTPPLGYTGSIKELLNERRLLSRHLILEDASKEAIEKVYALHTSAKGQKKPQYSIRDEDSDVTGDESS